MSRRPEDWEPEYALITQLFPKRLAEMMGDMTFTQLSLLSGVSVGTLTNWKHGRTIPDLCCLFAVCTVLDASIDWIVGLDEMASDDTQSDADDTQPAVDDTQPNVYYIQPTERDES